MLLQGPFGIAVPIPRVLGPTSLAGRSEIAVRIRRLPARTLLGLRDRRGRAEFALVMRPVRRMGLRVSFAKLVFGQTEFR